MRKKSLLYVNIAVLLFGLAGLFGKWISLPSYAITFGRVLFSSLTLFLVLMLTKQPLRVTRRDLLTMVSAGGILAVHWTSFLASVQFSTVAIGTLTFSAFPLFVTFFEPVVFRTRLRRKNVLFALLMLLGVAITVPELSLRSSYVQGILLGLLSALTYAFLTLINKSFSTRYSGTLISFYEQATAAAVLLPAVLILRPVPTAGDLGLLLLLGIFTTALAHTLYIRSLRDIPATLAGIVSSMETVYGILLAFLLLGEAPGLREILGAALIIGVVIISQLSEEA